MRRGLSISEYGVTGGRDRRGASPRATRRSSTSSSATSSSRPSCARTRGELEAARRGRAARSSSRWATCAATCTRTRPGRRTGRTRSRRWRAPRRRAATRYLAVTDHSHYLREGRLEAQDEEIDALNERLKPFRLLQGVEVNIRADGTLDVAGRDARRAATGWSRRSTPRFDDEPDRARPRRDGEPARRLHRPPDRAEDQQARRRGHRPRAGLREGARDRHRASRSTRSPTGSTCRDADARLAGEAGVRIVDLERRALGSRRSATSSSASARRAARG